MYGSSASNEYGNGGTVKATGLSSRVRFESESVVVPARKRPGAACPAQAILRRRYPYSTKSFDDSRGPQQCGGQIDLRVELYSDCPGDGNAAQEGHHQSPALSRPRARPATTCGSNNPALPLSLDPRKRPTRRCGH